MNFPTGYGAPEIAKLPYKWLNSMVYGRYNELVHGGYYWFYKPTNITGGPHPVSHPIKNRPYGSSRSF